MEKGTIKQLHHNFRTGGLAAHDQSKTRNPIQDRHIYTNKVGMMVTIHPHSVVHASQLLKALKVLSNL